jgi:hypothetical protein
MKTKVRKELGETGATAMLVIFAYLVALIWVPFGIVMICGPR